MYRTLLPIRPTIASVNAALAIGSFCCRLLLRTTIAGVFVCAAFNHTSQAQTPFARPSRAVAMPRATFQAPAPPQRPAIEALTLKLQNDRQARKPNPPIHVYPPGVLRNLQHAGSGIQQVTMQEVFPPPLVGDVLFSDSASTHETFPSGELSLSIPVREYFPSTPEASEQTSASPDFDEDGALLWWENDLPQTVLRNRQPIPLTLHRALGLALTEAPELHILHSDWYIQQTEVDRLDAAFDWTTFVDSVWNRDSAPVSSTLDGATSRLRSRTLNATGGIRRRSIDGSEFELSQSAGLRNSNSQFISPNNQANSRLALNYERPLLRGAGEDYNTSPQKLAVIAKDAAFDRFQAGIQDHLLAVATSYWTLVLQRGRFVQAVRSWNRATSIAEEMATRTEIDVTPNMLDRSRSEVASRLARAIESEHDIFRAQDSLLRLIYGPRFTDFANNEVVTTTLPMRKSEPVQPEPQIALALQNRSEIHQMIREIKAASTRYNVAANEVLPQLNMVLTSYVAGLHGDNDVGQSFFGQFTEGEPGVGIGFNFEIPYRNRAAQALAEQTHIGMKRVKAQLQLTMGEVSEDVREQVIQRNKYGAVLKQRWESLARARRILKYTETRREVLADGTQVADLYLENLLQMQSRLASAEAIYLEAQVRYALADNGLLRAISELETIADESVGENCEACLADADPSDKVTEQTEVVDTQAGHSLATPSAEQELEVPEPLNEQGPMPPVPQKDEVPVSFGHTF